MGDIMLVSTKGQITLPAALRAKFGIGAGDRVVGEYCGDGFIIRKPRDFFSFQGNFSGGKIPDNEEDLLDIDAAKHILERK